MYMYFQPQFLYTGIIVNKFLLSQVLDLQTFMCEGNTEVIFTAYKHYNCYEISPSFLFPTYACVYTHEILETVTSFDSTKTAD